MYRVVVFPPLYFFIKKKVIKIEIRLYNYDGDLRNVNKGIDTDSYNYKIDNACWMDDTSMTDPVITITGISDAIDILKNNYAYIPRFGRFYFINDFEYREGGVIAVIMHCDVLKSFATDICKGNTQLVARQENLVDNDIPDSLLPLYSRNVVENVPIGTIEEGASVVFTTSGSGRSED